MHFIVSCFGAGAVPSSRAASWPFGTALMTPYELLDHVEGMLGLGYPPFSQAERIAQYQSKLSLVPGEPFWFGSFEADPWATTRELLGWRDQLVEAGWSPHTLKSAPPRLRDLAAAELGEGPLMPGMFDRLAEVLEALAEGPRLPLKRVSLVEARDYYPLGWRRLLSALEQGGVLIDQHLGLASSSSTTDLGLLRASMTGSSPVRPLSGDGSCILLEGANELVVAEALAAWCAADASQNENLVFVLTGETSVLNHAFARAGLPRLGLPSHSPHRAALQVLPLAFAMAWAPPEIDRLLELLLLPGGPIRGHIARRLVNALVQQPGIGGPKWGEAWVEIDKDLRSSKADAGRSNAELLQRTRAWIESDRFDPEDGIPRARARAIADRVRNFATRRYSTTENELWLELGRAADDLDRALVALGMDKVERLLLEEMIEQALGHGASDPFTLAEAAPWGIATHPGGVYEDADTIIWWHFTDARESPPAPPWDSSEREALASTECPLDEPEREIRRVATAWERPLLAARKRLILVRPLNIAGQPTAQHPLWHRMAAGRKDLEKAIRVEAEQFLRNGRLDVGDRKIDRSPVSLVRPLEPSRAGWEAPLGLIRLREQESASSLTALISCPLQWTLRYAGHLRPSLRARLPRPDQIIGSLAHLLADQIFQPGPPPDPATARTRARELLEDYLPKVAAPLLAPGQARDLDETRRVVPEALAEVARLLRQQKLSVEATETSQQLPNALLPEIGIRGFLDLVAEGRAGKLVIDFKWQQSDKGRRDEIRQGRAIQLAIYRALMSQSKKSVSAGYYLLRQRQFLQPEADAFGTVTGLPGLSLEDTWTHICDATRELAGELASGVVHAPGHRKKKDRPTRAITVPVLCKYCDFQALCGAEGDPS